MQSHLQFYGNNTNFVDSWISQLDEHSEEFEVHNTTQVHAAALLAQQNLPRMTIPIFDGSAELWVEFITKFRDLVHNEKHLNGTRKSAFLIQHLTDEAKRSVKGLPNNWRGYVLALKRLKFLFGDKSKIAEAIIYKMTRGKPINNDDRKGLTDYYYTISDCLVILKQLNYVSDLYSSDVLRRAVGKLPRRLHLKWAEHSAYIRARNMEPNLIHFEDWLQKRIIAQREIYASPRDTEITNEKKTERSNFNGLVKENEVSCLLCSQPHQFWKCEDYKKLSPEDKYQYVRKMRRCFCCLRVGHGSRYCPSKYNCFVSGCSKKHHTSLHEHFCENDNNGTKKVTVEDKNKSNDSFNGVLKSEPRDMFLQVVPVMLKSAKGRRLSTYALLDAGSHVTLVRDDIAERLKLRGTARAINIATVKDEPKKVSVHDVALNIVSTDGKCEFKVDSAYAVSKSNFKMPSQPCPADYKNSEIYTHLDGINLAAVDKEDITVLIGANVPEALLVKNVRRGRKDQPLAIETMFGWTLFGSSSRSKNIDVTVSLLHTPQDHLSPVVTKLWDKDEHSCHVGKVTCEPESELHELVQNFWRQENYVITCAEEVAMSAEDSQALLRLKSETKNVNGRYQVPMLWKKVSMKLPNNIELAKSRFKFLLKRLRSDPSLYEKYKEVIDNYVRQGHARKMTSEEAACTTEKTWYLPHHPVFNVNKPGKVRVVKDAAAVYRGVSLNKSLITGPDLLSSLVGVLMRFRIGRIAIVADIEAMFHQVRVSTKDADALRFLWTDDINSEGAQYTMQMLVHVFGAKDSLTAALYALHQTARDNNDNFSPMTIEAVLRSFYVDDLLKSVESEEAAVILVKELIALLKFGGFRLTKWISNSQEVLETVPECEVASQAAVNLDTEHLERTLGICWSVSDDCFTFTFALKGEVDATKRGMLKVTSSIFDPLGFLSPFILKAKILLQELWRHNYEWDDKIEGDILKCWRKWLKYAELISAIKVNRCYSLNGKQIEAIQIHIFCDASELAYGSVAYIRYCYADGSYHCALVMSKSKLAPIKAMSLPRLELCAAVTAVRLFRKIIAEIDLTIDKVWFWSDSTLVLQYVSNTTHRFKTFVANRITEILDATERNQWNHVPGKLNPADIVSRGVIDPTQLMVVDEEGSSWLNGPGFLQKNEDQWPKATEAALKENDPEIKKREVLVTFGTFQTASPVIEFARFSSWTKLQRVAGWVFRFTSNCRATSKDKGPLSCDELESAGKRVILQLQKDSFGEEIGILSGKGGLPAGHVLAALSPFLDEEGLLRVGGRLRYASIPDASKYPIIMPKDSHVTKLVVVHEHRRNGHVGPEHVLSSLRQRYWIVHGRSVVKGVIRRCFYCQVKRAKITYPFMANLPPSRVAYREPPFSNCGVDMFGPIFIKQGRQRLKRWGILFTCLTIRCVHLEVVEKSETDAFINALRRFVNRRGCPKFIYSDQGSNFKGAASELKDVIQGIDREKIEEFSASNGIVWKFNPPLSPHMGGVWERLIRSTKEIMSALLVEKILTDQQLYTLMTEVEAILNNRPLTHLSENPEDLDPLTPNHVLLGLHRNWSSMMSSDQKDISSRRQWKQVQAVSKIFWDRWIAEYLPELTKRNKWKEKLASNYRVGELVLVDIDDDKFKKGSWNLGRIVEMIPGNDGVVRVVKVRARNGFYTRPIVRIGKLEDNEFRQDGEC